MRNHCCSDPGSYGVISSSKEGISAKVSDAIFKFLLPGREGMKGRVVINPLSIKGTFYFDPQDRIYEDHFPGRAVVPGSLIVRAFLEAGKSAGFGSQVETMGNFRFKEFIAPGAYAFSIEDRDKGWQCRLYHEGRTVASGLLHTTA